MVPGENPAASGPDPGAGGPDAADAGPDPVAAGPDPAVAAAVRRLLSRQGWSRAAGALLVLAALAALGGHEASSSGTPPPLWYQLAVAGTGALTAVCAAVAAAQTFRLRRSSPGVRARADALFAEYRARQGARHNRRWTVLVWAVLWAGALMIAAIAVVSVPAVVNGVAYLAGAEKTVTFTPVSHETVCHTRGGCETVTEGVMETGGRGTEATWPHEVPLGKPFPIRQPLWSWGLGASLIDSPAIAVVAIVVSLLIEVGSVFIAVRLARRVRNRWRHRRELAVLGSPR
jgi:hypothetical protein